MQAQWFERFHVSPLMLKLKIWPSPWNLESKSKREIATQALDTKNNVNKLNMESYPKREYSWQPVAWKTKWQKEQLQLYCQWSVSGKCRQALSRSLQTVALEVVQPSKVQQSECMEVQLCWMQCFLWYPYFRVWPCESKKNNVQKQ